MPLRGPWPCEHCIGSRVSSPCGFFLTNPQPVRTAYLLILCLVLAAGSRSRLACLCGLGVAAAACLNFAELLTDLGNVVFFGAAGVGVLLLRGWG